MTDAARINSRWLCAAALALFIATHAAAQVTTGTDKMGRGLNLWFNEGSAAGLTAMTYENRDGGHSAFDAAQWPQLRVYRPADEEKSGNLTLGGAMKLRPFPLIGNASMASPADRGGCIPRMYALSPSGMGFLFAQYINNNLFIYPAHHDHDPGWNGVGGWGDLLQVNTPYVIISQGSSGTDQPFLRAIVSAIAALPPATQMRLIHSRQLMPVIQSLFRRSNRMVRTEEDYFTGRAHPPVFRGADIDEEKFVSLAHGLTSFAIPPVVVLEVQSESPAPQPGRDFFELPSVSDERLTDTPGAIARIFRGRAWRRELAVSARRSIFPNGHDAGFRWVLLQGDANRVNITPSNDGKEARITVAWHPELRADSGIASHRVDIGVFAHSGINWSAPAFITFYMLPNEARFYAPDGRLEEIVYQADNPHIGLPPPDDPRWLALGRKLAENRDSAAAELFRNAQVKGCAEALKQLADEFAPQQEQWRHLNADAGKKAEAGKMLGELRSQIQARMEKSFAGNGVLPLSSAVESVFSELADRPGLYLDRRSAIEELVKASAQAAEFHAARKRLVDLRVFQEKGAGEYSLCVPEKNLSSGQRAVLRGFHLVVLSLALFPEFLERSNKPAFVDPRLTTPKAWRDVHHVDGAGRSSGWTRHANGRAFELDASGRFLPEGQGGRGVEVRFTRDESTGLLLFVPK